jgi:hypothetical protein
MAGRRQLVTLPKLRTIDRWYAQSTRNKSPPAKVLAHQLGLSISTIYNAASRRGAYAGVPKVNEKLFADLLESMTQMNEIVRGERAPSREFHVDVVPGA